MRKILLFAGTSEGRRLAEYLSIQEVELHICVATAYGEQLLPEGGHTHVHVNRMDEVQMFHFMNKEQFTLVIDATHPFATEVSANIRWACAESGQKLIRVLRREEEQIGTDCIFRQSIQEAVSYLEKKEGNILVTTGSKEIEAYESLSKERVYYRVLSTSDVVEKCSALGIEGRHLFAMQGPFSESMNLAMLLEVGASYLVTKESGQPGGYEAKINAAQKAGVIPVVIGRPVEKSGYSLAETFEFLQNQFGWEKEVRKVTLIGIGMGSEEGITGQAKTAIEGSEVILGATRMLQTISGSEKPMFALYRPEEIYSFLLEHTEYSRIAVVVSGDIGFYSGTKKIKELLNAYDVNLICGVAAPCYLLSKLGKPWEKVKMVSTHGREGNIIGAVKKHSECFSLLGGEGSVRQLCDSLLQNGLEDVELTIGEALSYENEKITSGTPSSLRNGSYDTLAAAYIRNPSAVYNVVTHGIADEDFLRGEVPMTKSEVRSISLSKLKLCRKSVLYDIGSGTGSVAIESALQAEDGWVYAIEKEETAAALIQKNQFKFGVTNLTVLLGKAPDVFASLPIPTHAFIGGSSGNMEEILLALLQKNPQIRIVVNAAALETIAQMVELTKKLPLQDLEFVQVAIAKSRQLGNYQMMRGENPVYVISFSGEG